MDDSRCIRNVRSRRCSPVRHASGSRSNPYQARCLSADGGHELCRSIGRIDRQARKGSFRPRVKVTAIAAATIIAATAAHADTYWYCKGDECVGRSVGPANRLGTYNNPIQDELEGDLSVPVHRGMYCAAAEWHHGWLRPWERSPVIKASCGTAVYQMPH
jgi:hypothetical protein